MGIAELDLRSGGIATNADWTDSDRAECRRRAGFDAVRFYADHSLTLAKSFGSKYVEFDIPATDSRLGSTLAGPAAKDAGVARALAKARS